MLFQGAGTGNMLNLRTVYAKDRYGLVAYVAIRYLVMYLHVQADVQALSQASRWALGRPFYLSHTVGFEAISFVPPRPLKANHTEMFSPC